MTRKTLKLSIQEHGIIPNSSEYREVLDDGLRLPDVRQGLVRWFCRWERQGSLFDTSSKRGDEEGYYASYVVGAQWIDAEHNTSLVVTPKAGCDNIDFLAMFMTCFHSGSATEEFSRIYDINWDKPRIEAPELNSVLSPLIIVHYLSLLREITRRGLKKDFVSREDNLKKVKGHIAILRNERSNILPRRFDRIYCKYQEYSVNIPENRLLKKALLFAYSVLQQTSVSKSLLEVRQAINECLVAFTLVDSEIEVWEVKHIKQHKVYREYNEAIRLAQMLLRRYDYSLTNIHTETHRYCPVFWLDMSLLYEHYILGLLRKAYGDKIEYQAKGYSGYPDFICKDPMLVMDSKYIPHLSEGRIDTTIVRQLSAYARDYKLFPKSKGQVVPCMVIYPKEGEAMNPFQNVPLEMLAKEEDKHYSGFYRIAVPLPIQSKPQ